MRPPTKDEQAGLAAVLALVEAELQAGDYGGFQDTTDAELANIDAAVAWLRAQLVTH